MKSKTISLEDGFGFEGKYTVLFNPRNSEVTARIHYLKGIASATRPSGASISQPPGGVLKYITQQGITRRFEYSESKKDWIELPTEQAEYITVEKNKEKEVNTLDLPDGYTWQKVSLPTCQNCSAILGDRYDLTEDISFLENGGIETGHVTIPFETPALISIRGDRYSLKKEFVSENCYRCIIIDTIKDESCVYECVKQTNLECSWSELYLKASCLKLKNRKYVFWGAANAFSSLALLASIGLPYSVYAHDLPYSIKTLSCVFSAYFFYIAILFAVDFRYGLIDPLAGYSFSIGSIYFSGNGSIIANGTKYCFGAIDETIVDDIYQLTSQSKSQAILRCGDCQAIITASKSGVLAVKYEFLEGVPSRFRTSYNAFSGLNVFQPDRISNGFGYEDIPTNVGVVHAGFSGGSFVNSMDIGGVTMFSDGTITYGDAIIPPDESIKQTRFRDLLISKKRSLEGEGFFWVRLVQLSGELCWLFRYENLPDNGQSLWNQMRIMKIDYGQL